MMSLTPDSVDMNQVLVSGANGFIGGAVVTRLVADGCKVAGAVRQHKRLSWEVHSPSLGSDADWRPLLAGKTVVIHTAARAHMLHDRAADALAEFRRVNVEGTLRMAQQAAAMGVRRFVFVSSIGVNGGQSAPGKSFSETDKPAPHNAYALSKWEAEQSLLRISNETGLEVVIIRPPLVYGYGAPGNFGSLKRAVQGGWPLPLGAVHNQRSLVALDNLVDFIVTCTTHPQAANQTFLVSDGQDLSTTALVRGMVQAAGVSACLLPVPVWALQIGAALLGKGEMVKRLSGNLQVDISKAKELLSWVPAVSVDEGLRKAMVR
jgi:nucleoside-diphosphate-sugar epimerase